MRSSKTDPSRASAERLARIPFDPREERIIDGMARWMGVLGRFQVLAGGLLLLTVLGIAIAYGTTEAFETPAEGPDARQPLVTLGDIEPQQVLIVGIVALVVGGIVLRGGVLLTDAAEDFERVVHSDDRDENYLENALRRLRGYYRMELVLMLGFLALVSVWAIPGWS